MIEGEVIEKNEKGGTGEGEAGGDEGFGLG